MAELKGKDYIALRRLSTKDDQTLAVPGETCERVPASSLPSLLASGKIRIADAEVTPVTDALDVVDEET